MSMSTLIDIDSTDFEQLNQVKQQLEKISGVRKVRLLKKPERS